MIYWLWTNCTKITLLLITSIDKLKESKCLRSVHYYEVLNFLGSHIFKEFGVTRSRLILSLWTSNLIWVFGLKESKFGAPMNHWLEKSAISDSLRDSFFKDLLFFFSSENNRKVVEGRKKKGVPAVVRCSRRTMDHRVGCSVLSRHSFQSIYFLFLTTFSFLAEGKTKEVVCCRSGDY